MNSICIIPARAGSKRIPRKNILPFNGKPIIAYSIETAINSGIFDEVMVSTDSEEIADIAKQYGANVPFLRSSDNANDFAGIAEVLLEVLDMYKENFDLCGCLLPTAPMLKPIRIQEAYQLMLKKGFDSVFPVLQYDYPIQRSFRIEEGKAILNWPDNYSKRSQDLRPNFHDAGQFYLITTEKLHSTKKLFTDNSGVIQLNSFEAHDIDSPEDWKMAELKMKYLQNY